MPILNTTLALYVAAGVLAFIPALIWLTLLFKKTKRRGIQLLIFLGSTFSVVPVFLLQYFLDLFPQFDVLHFLQATIENQNINFILLFISVGIVEEIVKQGLIRLVDKKYLLIQTINESIHFSLIGALGFAFAENIFYIYNIYTQFGLQQLFIAYLFRSVFTTCAHLIFSGFFGYYYGIAKFSLNIVEHAKWSGKKNLFTNFIARLLQISKIQAYKEVMILKGLGIAIALHATFNFLLQFNQIILVVLFVLFSGYLLMNLLRSKTGRLILITDADSEKTSNMLKKDEEVVIELLGMWFNKQRYVDVIHICQRLLERDPDNKVVQLFKTRAFDKLDNKNAYNLILKNLFPGKKQKSIAEMAQEQLTKKPVSMTKVIPKPITTAQPPPKTATTTAQKTSAPLTAVQSETTNSPPSKTQEAMSPPQPQPENQKDQGVFKLDL